MRPIPMLVTDRFELHRKLNPLLFYPEIDKSQVVFGGDAAITSFNAALPRLVEGWEVFVEFSKGQKKITLIPKKAINQTAFHAWELKSQ